MNFIEVKVVILNLYFNKQKEDIFIYGDGDGLINYKIKK